MNCDKVKHLITATVYDKKGRVLSKAINDYEKTHPQMSRLSARCHLTEKIYLHAEVLAIIRAFKNGKPYKIKVERFNKNGQPLLAKPCPICEMFIKESGIKLVEYTI